MPRYEYRCRACGDTFLVTRPMSASGDPATCPQGHDDTVKLFRGAGLGGMSSGDSTSAGDSASVGGGGGCGCGSCGCGG